MDTKVLVTPQLIAGVLSIIFSLLFTYFPKLNTWYAGLTTEAKSGIMILGTALISGFLYLASCQAWLVTDLVCTQEGLIGLVKIFFVALVANQATYLVSPQPKPVQAAKLSRSTVG